MTTALALPDAPHESTDPLSGVIAAWLHAKGARSGSQRTVDAYRTTLAAFRTHLQAHGLDLTSPTRAVALAAQAWSTTRQPRPPRRDARTQTLTAWTPQPTTPLPTVAAATIQQRRAILASFYRYAIQHAVLEHNPCTLLETVHVEQYAHAVPLPAETATQRLAAIPRTTLVGQRDYALLALALSTGRRRTELATLTWGQIQAIGDLATWEDAPEPPTLLLTYRAKGNKTVRDRLEPPVARAFLHYQRRVYGPLLGTLPADAPCWLAHAPRLCGQWEPLQPRALADIWRRRLGTSKVHSTRHTYAHAMERSGAPISVIQARLGHASLATTGRYLTQLTSDENPYGGLVAARLGIV